MLSNTFTLCLMTATGQRLVLDLRKVSTDDSLSTTRVGREVERAIEALPPSRSPSPIVFADRPGVLPVASGLSARSSDARVHWDHDAVGARGAAGGDGGEVGEEIELTT